MVEYLGGGIILEISHSGFRTNDQGKSQSCGKFQYTKKHTNKINGFVEPTGNVGSIVVMYWNVHVVKILFKQVLARGRHVQKARDSKLPECTLLS